MLVDIGLFVGNYVTAAGIKSGDWPAGLFWRELIQWKIVLEETAALQSDIPNYNKIFLPCFGAFYEENFF